MINPTNSQPPRQDRRLDCHTHRAPSDTAAPSSYVNHYSMPSAGLRGPAKARDAAALPPPTLGQQHADEARQSAPGTALDAALYLIGMGLPLRLVPVFDGGASLRWSQAAGSRAEILARRSDWRRAVGVADVSGSLIALDPDSEPAELVAAELVGDGPAGFRIQSRRGVHRVYLRGDALPADHRANLVHDERRPAEALADKLDVVAGAVRLWHRGKTWLGDPSSIGPMPDRLRDAIAACWAARSSRLEADAEAARRRAELAEGERQQRAGSDDADRLRRYAAATLAGIQADASALPDGQRGRGIFSAAFKAGRLVGASWSGMVEADAEAAMLAAIDACGYDTRQGLGHARRGIRAGMRDPRDPPESRELVRATMPPDRLAELERRAAACADTRAQARAAGINPRSASKVAALAAELAGRAIDEGRPTVCASMDDLGLVIGRGPAAISRAVPIMQALGWTVTLGGIGDADRAKATAWTMPKATGRALPQNATLCGGASASAAGCPENPSERPRCVLRQSPGVAARGLRRGLGKPAERAERYGNARGGLIHAALLADAAPLSLGGLAAAAGMPLHGKPCKVCRGEAPGEPCAVRGRACTIDKLAPLMVARGWLETLDDGQGGTVYGPTDRARTIDPLLPGCGDSVAQILAALGDAVAEQTPAELAARAGLSVDTVLRGCRRLLAFGAVNEGRAATAGRPSAAFALTVRGRNLLRGIMDGIGGRLAEAVKVGERGIRKAAAAIERKRAELAEARALARSLGVSVAVALAHLRARLRRLAIAERDTSRELAGSAAVAEHKRAEGKAQGVAGAARRAWLEADLRRQAVVAIGAVPAW